MDKRTKSCQHPGVRLILRAAYNGEITVIKLKEGKQAVKQYPLKRQDREGISLRVKNFLELGLLKEHQSEFNSPILPV